MTIPSPTSPTFNDELIKYAEIHGRLMGLQIEHQMIGSRKSRDALVQGVMRSLMLGEITTDQAKDYLRGVKS